MKQTNHVAAIGNAPKAEADGRTDDTYQLDISWYNSEMNLLHLLELHNDCFCDDENGSTLPYTQTYFYFDLHHYKVKIAKLKEGTKISEPLSISFRDQERSLCQLLAVNQMAYKLGTTFHHLLEKVKAKFGNDVNLGEVTLLIQPPYLEIIKK